MKGEVMFPLIIAESRHHERADVEGNRWSTYRVRKVSEDEYTQLRNDNLIPPGSGRWIIERQHIKTEDGVETPDVGPWELWTVGNSPDEAILDVLGDTNFRQALSLHLAHAELVLYSDKLRSANQRKCVAIDASNRASEEHREETYRGNQEYSKATLKYADNPKGLEKAKVRIRAKYQPRLDALLADIRKQRQEQANADEEYERLKLARPKLLDLIAD